MARSADKLEETKTEIEQHGGTAFVYSADLSDMDSIDELVKRMLADHAAIDMLVNSAGRSIRRGVKLAHDRFHDYERTMQLNYFGAIKLTMGLLPHMGERHFGHVVNVSSIGAQTNPPRFSAYVASKAALDAWTRVVSSELIGDGITFTTIHMPLVRTPMIAPTKMYDAFPTITPEEAGRHDLRGHPRQAQDDQHAPGHLRRGRLHAVAQVGGPDPAHGLQRLPRLRRPRRARRTTRRRPRWSRSRWPT